MHVKHYNATKSLIDIVDNVKWGNVAEEKRSGLYLDWIRKQAELFQLEMKPLTIPDRIFPKQLTSFAYNKNTSHMQSLISKYYDISKDSKSYIRNANVIKFEDAKDLLHKLVFLRGNVVWVEFGFNIGCEFGGKHPAIVLKNIGEALIVAPLTSGKPDKPRSSEIIIDMVFNLPKRDRYINITRITPISIYRVDLNSPTGSIRSKKMKEIYSAIKNDWK